MFTIKDVDFQSDDYGVEPYLNKLDISIEDAIIEKIRKNELKYPVEKSYGSSKKYTEL